MQDKLGSYLVIPAAASRSVCSGGALALEGDEMQAMALCSCREEGRALHNPFLQRSVRLQVQAEALQQRLEEWFAQLSAEKCRFSSLQGRWLEIMGQASGAAVLATDFREDRMTVVALEAGGAEVWLVTPDGGLIRLRGSSVVTLPCMLLCTSLPSNPLRSGPDAENLLLTTLLEADTPDACRRAMARALTPLGGGLRMLSFWGWADFDSVKKDMRGRQQRVKELCEHLNSLCGEAAAEAGRQFAPEYGK